jgi:hypothetical protein
MACRGKRHRRRSGGRRSEQDASIDIMDLIIQLVTLGTAILSFGAASFSWRKSRSNGTQIHEVHDLVNQKMTDVQDRVVQLTDTLDNAGVEVPEVPKDK